MASPDSKAPPRMDSSSEEAGKNEEIMLHTSSGKSSFAKRIWDKSGLNAGMLVLMVKGALPPTISLALYQDTGFATKFQTLGYLVAIMSTLSFAIMPRAKFVQTMVLNIVGICIGAAVTLLAIYCVVQARAHTTPTPQTASGGPTPGAQVLGYNSSASAVSAIWLFVNIYFINALRTARPQLQFPTIMYSIFVNVALTNAPLFLTMKQGMAFAKQLLEAVLTGFAIAAIISFLVFPMTSRIVLLKQLTGFLTGLQGSLKAQANYLQSLERDDIFNTNLEKLDDTKKNKGNHFNNRKQKYEHLKSEESLEAKTLKSMMNSLGELYSKMSVELTFAKKEIAYGKLDATDLEQMFKLSRSILLPINGMSSIADIFDRIAESRGWKSTTNDQPQEKDNIESTKINDIAQWNNIMKALHSPFEVMTEAMSEGLQHVLYTFELVKQPEKDKSYSKAQSDNLSRDVEAEGDVAKPGDKEFAMSLTKKVNRFYDQRKLTLEIFCNQKGINVDQNIFGDSSNSVLQSAINSEDISHDKKNQRQLYLILYMEFLLWSTGQAILDLVRFADLKTEQGLTNKKRIVVPGFKRFKKWVLNVLKLEDTDMEHTPDNLEVGSSGIYAGDSFKAAKDPEHLPPANGWERFTNGIRSISHFLASPESAFGFRAACATLTIGIIAYLADTQIFFIRQRLVWALIMVAISMTTTAGSGIFGFLGRIAGTAIAMCASIACWYIVDGKTGGVLPLLWLFITIEFYFIIRFPRFLIVALLSIVTQILIIGYELEVRKLGLKAATSSGQPAYPIYLLAPYRLACVTGGMAVAFMWTFFPYPITARSQLRKDLGASLYLLANFYSIVHTTVQMRIQGEEGDMDSKSSHGRKLEKARTTVFAKQLALLAGLRQHSAFTSWEPTFGGKFPKAKYDIIIDEIQNILNYMALISYASKDFTDNTHNHDPDQTSWLRDMERLVQFTHVTSHEITSLLALLSASVTNGSMTPKRSVSDVSLAKPVLLAPLPPYLKKPQPFRLSERLEALDADILSINHIAEPGYAAFAVMQIASSMIGDDLGKLIENVKSLVGEVDFSFHTISTTTTSTTTQSSNDSLDASKGKTD